MTIDAFEDAESAERPDATPLLRKSDSKSPTIGILPHVEDRMQVAASFPLELEETETLTSLSKTVHMRSLDDPSKFNFDSLDSICRDSQIIVRGPHSVTVAADFLEYVDGVNAYTIEPVDNGEVYFCQYTKG